MAKVLSWHELTQNQKIQAIQTYKSIRAEEEEILETEVDISGVVNCSFEIEYCGYVSVLI